MHDYLYEFGGAERVLLALSEIWPSAPIYTAFCSEKSPARERFKGRDIRTSWFNRLPFASRLASPLRFMLPLIWKKFDFSEYDLLISSASWFVTKGFTGKSSKTVEVCYCHTPPRYLYGYSTSIKWRKYFPVRVYGELVGHFLRIYDFRAAQRVDHFVANSKNVKARIRKFYRRNSKVIYPPVEISRFYGLSHQTRYNEDDAADLESFSTASRGGNPSRDYFLVVSRLVGSKGLELAIEAANQLKVPLKVVGRASGWGTVGERLRRMAGDTVEFLGEVDDSELARLYAGAKSFLATAEDEDFGITPVEAMACGTPVIAYRGGGYLETVVEGETGLFFDDFRLESLMGAMQKIVDNGKFSQSKLRFHARKFSKERFKREIEEFVEGVMEG